MRRQDFQIILTAFALDQVSKYMVLHFFTSPPFVRKITGFFDLVLVYNTGVSFSLFSDTGAQNTWAVVGATGLMSLVLFRWMLQEKAVLTRFALALIVGGALGNLIDRLWRPGVVDFIQLHAGSFYWPAFNVADVAICVGAGLILLDGLRCMKKERV